MRVTRAGFWADPWFVWTLLNASSLSMWVFALLYLEWEAEVEVRLGKP